MIMIWNPQSLWHQQTKHSAKPLIQQFFCHPDSGWSHDQPQPGSFFQRPREAEKRDPGNEVVSTEVPWLNQIVTLAIASQIFLLRNKVKKKCSNCFILSSELPKLGKIVVTTGKKRKWKETGKKERKKEWKKEWKETGKNRKKEKGEKWKKDVSNKQQVFLRHRHFNYSKWFNTILLDPI